MRTKEQKQFFRENVISETQKLFGETCCRLCGQCMDKSKLDAHHVLPLNSGGENDPFNNGLLVGSKCHIELHDRHNGKLTIMGKLLLKGFIQNSKLRSYGKQCRKS